VGDDYLALCRAMGPAELRGTAGQIMDVLAGQLESVRLDYDLELDQRRQWFTVLATRFVTQGTPRVVLMHQNVTERRLMELQLQQAQKLESIGQLAAGIAHEINTPTQYIGDNTIFLRGAFEDLWRLLGLLRLQLEGSGQPEQIELARQALDQADLGFLEAEIPRAINASLEGIRRVSNIVSAMKDFSHPGGSLKLPTDLNRAIESTVLVCQNEWKYVANLDLDLDPQLAPVPCFPDQFNQVILNLIINAAHAIGEAPQAGKGLIKITTRSLPGFAQISVADSGNGIPEAIRSRIFDPFFTTKPVGRGTGQGLAIAHAVIVDQHGGTIDLDSIAGKGATFILRLPVQELP
jgi:signal transduction histidine kinase